MELKLSEVAVMNTTKSLDYMYDVTGCAFSHSADIIAVCGNTHDVDLPGEVVLWDLKNSTLICRKKFNSSVHEVEFSFDNKYYVVVTKTSFKIVQRVRINYSTTGSLYVSITCQHKKAVALRILADMRTSV